MDWQTYRNIRRLKDISVTLIRYGFGGIVAEMRILPFLSVVERVFVLRKARGLTVPERIRSVLEDLGPTFVKLGQIASTRADLFPHDWVDEFKKLQDSVPPFPFEDVRKVVEGALRAPLEERFSSFDPVPVASASIAQVHYATLRDSTPVAVKVKRPGISKVIESDIEVMYTIADLLVKYVPASRRYRPRDVVDEFSRVIKNEQDLTVEGGYINRFHNLFNGDPNIQIPRVYWDYTTKEVLTMERVSGTPIDEVEKIRAMGLDVRAIAHRGLELFFKQVFDFGIFHADLHPGNIFVRDDGVIIYLDFGIIGRLDRKLRNYLASILYCLVREDYRRMALIHREMGLVGEDVDIHEFEEALRDISEPIFGRTLEQIQMSALLMKLLQTARHFNMQLQPNLLLLQKSMVIIEGVGRQLYPDINMWEVAKPLIRKWMLRERFSPKAVSERVRLHGEDLFEAAYELPVRLNTLMEKTLKGDLKIGFVQHRLGELTGEIESAGRRVSGGIFAGSLIVAATVAFVFSEEGAVTFLGVPLISLMGFILAFVIALRLWAIPERKKED